MNLVKMFIKRVTMELESVQYSDRESSQESLLLQGVNFAYRAHQVIILEATFLQDRLMPQLVSLHFIKAMLFQVDKTICKLSLFVWCNSLQEVLIQKHYVLSKRFDSVFQDTWEALGSY